MLVSPLITNWGRVHLLFFSRETILLAPVPCFLLSHVDWLVSLGGANSAGPDVWLMSMVLLESWFPK